MGPGTQPARTDLGEQRFDQRLPPPAMGCGEPSPVRGRVRIRDSQHLFGRLDHGRISVAVRDGGLLAIIDDRRFTASEFYRILSLFYRIVPGVPLRW